MAIITSNTGGTHHIPNRTRISNVIGITSSGASNTELVVDRQKSDIDTGISTTKKTQLIKEISAKSLITAEGAITNEDIGTNPRGTPGVYTEEI